MQEVKDMIRPWMDQHVLLTKHEDGDIDKTVLKLKAITIVEREPSIDDYVSPQALQLHGNGFVLFKDRRTPLPYERYDIPLTDQLHVHRREGALHIVTERAQYTIELQ